MQGGVPGSRKGDMHYSHAAVSLAERVACIKLEQLHAGGNSGKGGDSRVGRAGGVGPGNGGKKDGLVGLGLPGRRPGEPGYRAEALVR